MYYLWYELRPPPDRETLLKSPFKFPVDQFQMRVVACHMPCFFPGLWFVTSYVHILSSFCKESLLIRRRWMR